MMDGMIVIMAAALLWVGFLLGMLWNIGRRTR